MLSSLSGSLAAMFVLAEPTKSIFPIFVATGRHPPLGRRFLGTGFFVRLDGVFLTAGHVLRDLDLEDDEYLAVVPLQIAGDHVKVFPMRVDSYRNSPDHDIAIGQAAVPEPVHPLELARETPRFNEDVVTCEYSGTIPNVCLADGKTAMELVPSIRKGHVVRYYRSDWPEQTPASVLDLSFPALKGASGAPVISEWDASVVGMVVANVERHLLPAQVETIHGSDGIVEHRTYFLPTGHAISWEHLEDCLSSFERERKLPERTRP